MWDLAEEVALNLNDEVYIIYSSKKHFLVSSFPILGWSIFVMQYRLKQCYWSTGVHWHLHCLNTASYMHILLYGNREGEEKNYDLFQQNDKTWRYRSRFKENPVGSTLYLPGQVGPNLLILSINLYRWTYNHTDTTAVWVKVFLEIFYSQVIQCTGTYKCVNSHNFTLVRKNTHMYALCLDSTNYKTHPDENWRPMFSWKTHSFRDKVLVVVQKAVEPRP